MDIYRNKSTWKILLAVIGVLIVICSMLYAQYLAGSLAERETINVNAYAKAVKSLGNNAKNQNDDTAMEFYIIDSLGNVPIILEGEEGKLVGYHYSDDDEETTDQDYLRKRVDKLTKNGFRPIEGQGYARYIYYENSKLHRHISLFPLVQFLLLSTFIAFGYYLFSTSRKAEQNRVWAGMAKETAHQLGTPISAIIGWIEYLKDLSGTNPEQLEVVEELRNDVTRLELIADRFSKIGSHPELEQVNLVDQLNTCKTYMQRRAARKMVFDFPELSDPAVNAKINKHLFDWVIENLLRNALDAMGNSGRINVRLYKKETKAIIEVADTGKGIPVSKHKAVFMPGYTTKKRGWGLGLSLAKRIIENYHSGKIYVKNSKTDEGTTFTIQLPLA